MSRRRKIVISLALCGVGLDRNLLSSAVCVMELVAFIISRWFRKSSFPTSSIRQPLLSCTVWISIESPSNFTFHRSAPGYPPSVHDYHRPIRNVPPTSHLLLSFHLPLTAPLGVSSLYHAFCTQKQGFQSPLAAEDHRQRHQLRSQRWPPSRAP